MRAAVLHGREDVRIQEVPEPGLQHGEVRIAIRAALTCGTDLKVFRRGYHAKMIVPPAVFGHEFAGVISELGPGVEGWKPGDRVVAANSAPCSRCFHCECAQEHLCDDLLFLNGAYAESIVVPARIVERNLLPLQPGTDFTDAALTEPLACVVQGLEESRVISGQRLLIIGCGPIGLMFVRLAAHAGAHVTAVGRGKGRLDAARRLGAAEVVNATAHPDWFKDTSLRGARGFDVVIEAVGKPEVWEQAVQVVRKGGLVNFFGGCPAGTSITLDTGLVHYSNLTLLASFHHTPRSIRRALRWIEDGVIRAADFVDGRTSLTALPDLLRSMAGGNRAVKTFVSVEE
ncbi:MAG: zinc-binding dehydrogenase [Verrucomicrobiales bacterium]|nr:zinc-binding dehydrogenase [Verrucomicrobiales bacterium]